MLEVDVRVNGQRVARMFAKRTRLHEDSDVADYEVTFVSEDGVIRGTFVHGHKRSNGFWKLIQKAITMKDADLGQLVEDSIRTSIKKREGARA